MEFTPLDYRDKPSSEIALGEEYVTRIRQILGEDEELDDALIQNVVDIEQDRVRLLIENCPNDLGSDDEEPAMW